MHRLHVATAIRPRISKEQGRSVFLVIGRMTTRRDIAGDSDQSARVVIPTEVGGKILSTTKETRTFRCEASIAPRSASHATRRRSSRKRRRLAASPATRRMTFTRVHKVRNARAVTTNRLGRFRTSTMTRRNSRWSTDTRRPNAKRVTAKTGLT